MHTILSCVGPAMNYLQYRYFLLTHILENFTAVQQVFVSPNPLYPKPRYKCLEDSASYFQHDVGADGKENMSAPLIGELLDVRCEPDSPELYT